jgi:tetratricopeptide (TPR) repeat protein
MQKNNASGGVNVCALDSYDVDNNPQNGNGFDDLELNGKFSIHYMISCNPGSYDKSLNNTGFDSWGDRISMAESFTTSLVDLGGPAIIANTDDGYGYYSEMIEKGFLESIFDNSLTNIGVALGLGKPLHPTNRTLMLCTTLFGDPELNIWTDVPEELDVAINYTTKTVTVTCDQVAVEDAKVYFETVNGSSVEIEETDSNGQATCTFNFQNFCVTKENYIPVIKRVIPTNETWTSETDVKWDVIVPSGKTLTISTTVNLSAFGGRPAQIIVENGGTLTLGSSAVINGEYTTFEPDEISAIQVTIPGNVIDVYGTLNVTSGSFESESSSYWDGVILNECGSTSLSNPTFEYCDLVSIESDLTITNGEFTNAHIYVEKCDLDIDGLDFTNGYVSADASDGFYTTNPKVTIESCEFSNTLTVSAISIDSYPDFEITENAITSNGNSIEIFESGTGSICEISNNSISGSSNGNGIYLYHTNADIIGCNHISGKNIGIVGLHNSGIDLTGNSSLDYQIISGNSDDEMLYNHDSFPLPFIYNEVFDTNHDDYYVNCSDHGTARSHSVVNNYWGSGFSASTDFNPSTAYRYTPQWLPGGGGDRGLDEDTYNLAQAYFDAAQYELARAEFQSIIESYPDSDYAYASIKELYSLEKCSDNDFASLQVYYDTEPNIQLDTELQKLSSYYSNYCNYELENFTEAISYFENIISNPGTVTDSVYAVIDLGYTYLLMQNVGRSGYVGQYSNLKPESKEAFQEIRKELLDDLLSGEENHSSIIPPIRLFNNYPNPFNPETTLSFSINEDSKVEMFIYNIKGQKVKTLVNDDLEEGVHEFVWKSKDDSGKSVASGIYFYKLEVNGKNKGLKKMLLLK